MSPSGNLAAELREKIENKNARIGILGLGYVGLPLAHAFIEAGFHAIGFDVDQRKVDKLSAGETYIRHISAELIQSWLERKRFEATTDMEQLATTDVMLICVPTPLNKSRDPDLKYIESTAKEISKRLRPGQLVVLESTTYPGTTRDVLVPILDKSGLTAGVDFFVGYSPEREDPGNSEYSARSIPKVVGGLESNSLELADALYSSAVVDTVPVSNCEIAEACKILENTYRSVNIAMVNEMKVLFHHLGIDIWEVIDAAKSKPFGFQAFYPGPGLGGHCIPIDPFYLSWLARMHSQSTRFIELAGEINTSMPQYVVDRVSDALNEHSKSVRGSKIGVLGIAYKKDVDDPRESPSFKLMELLSQRGAAISYADPHVPELPQMRSFDVPELSSNKLTVEYLEGLDCTLIATDHTAFDYELVVRHSKIVVDTRNATSNVQGNRGNVRKA